MAELPGKTSLKPRICWLVVSLYLMALLTGCSLFGSDGPLEVGNAATLRCSQECEERAQCGSIEGANQYVVLSGLNIQKVEPGLHDSYFIDGASVTIVNRLERKVQLSQPGLNTPAAPFDLTFYQVLAAPEDGGLLAWVAEYCVRGDSRGNAPTPTPEPVATPLPAEAAPPADAPAESG